MVLWASFALACGALVAFAESWHTIHGDAKAFDNFDVAI
jgi:hypothetical protein